MAGDLRSGRGARVTVVSRRTVLWVVALLVIAGLSVVTQARAAPVTLDSLRSADHVLILRPVERLPADEPGSERFTPLVHPTYDAAAGVGTDARVGLNQAAAGFGRDVSSGEEALGADQTEDDAIDDCLKSALWNMLFNAIWGTNHQVQFTPQGLWNASYNALLGCLQQRLGLDWVGASSLSNYFAEKLIGRGVAALRWDPTTTAFADWAAVTAFYSIPRG